MSTVTVTTAGDVQTVKIQADGPQGPPGPLGPWLGILVIDGKPNSGERVFNAQPGETLVFGANLADWHVAAGVEADAEAVARVYVNDVEYATITWQAQGTTPTMTTTGGAEFTVGPTDWFKVVMPLPADATLADISIRMAATRP